MNLYICMCICTHTRAHKHTHTLTHTHSHARQLISTCVRIYARTHTHTNKHTQTHTHTHTHTQPGKAIEHPRHLHPHSFRQVSFDTSILLGFFSFSQASFHFRRPLFIYAGLLFFMEAFFYFHRPFFIYVGLFLFTKVSFDTFTHAQSQARRMNPLDVYPPELGGIPRKANMSDEGKTNVSINKRLECLNK